MKEALFECTALAARITPSQCRANRSRPVSSSLASVPTRPTACLACTQWKEIDPPLPDAVDPVLATLAETLQALRPDVEYGRLGIKYLQVEYDSRAEAGFRRKKPQKMAELCRFQGFTILEDEDFRGVRGMACLLYDERVTCFVREHLRQEAPACEAGEGAAVAIDAAVDGIMGVVSQARQDGLEVRSAPEQNIFAVPCEDEDVWEEEDRAMPTPAADLRDAGEACAVHGVRTAMSAVASDADAPCAACRFFRPLPTFYDGVAGVRLCWARRPAWNFSCFSRRQG